MSDGIVKATFELIHALDALSVGPERGRAVLYLDFEAFEALRYDLGKFAVLYTSDSKSSSEMLINGIKIRRRAPKNHPVSEDNRHA